jgi:hypothetical protein
MIGMVRNTASFGNDLDYCLKNKLTPAREVACKERAEIIHFNECYGTRSELVQQFREVMEQNRNVLKPCLHVVLGISPEDQLTKSQWVDIADGYAKALGFSNHQYVAIMHHDTDHEHVHLLLNRIGFEGEVVRDRNFFSLSHQFCRSMEKEYHLKQLEGPRRYQTKEQRQEERKDERVVRLREDLSRTLKTACDYTEFEEGMKQEGYKVYKSDRGIAFYHDIVLRGGDAGYPWKKIESVLGENKARRLEQVQEQVLRQAELLRHGRQELVQRLEREQAEERRRGHRIGRH